jgi:hypothetical protein
VLKEELATQMSKIQNISDLMKDDLWKTLSSINNWVRFSEGKAIALLAAQGVLIGVLSKESFGSVEAMTRAQLILITIAMILNSVSMLFAFLCLNPRLRLHGGISPLYFGSISSSFGSSDEYYHYYRQKMSDADSSSKELSGQIFVNSQIAFRKYKYVAYSIRSLFLSIFIWVILILNNLY